MTYDAAKPINYGDYMAAEKPPGASPSQIWLINKIWGHTSLKPTGAILASESTGAWIDLALYSCTDNELGKIGKERTEKSRAEKQVKALVSLPDKYSPFLPFEFSPV